MPFRPDTLAQLFPYPLLHFFLPRKALQFFLSCLFLLCAIIIKAETFCEHLTPIWLTHAAKVDCVSTFLNNTVLLKIAGQSISDISSIRKRIARDTLFQAFHYQHLLSRYRTTPQQTLALSALNLDQHSQGYCNKAATTP